MACGFVQVNGEPLGASNAKSAQGAPGATGADGTTHCEEVRAFATPGHRAVTGEEHRECRKQALKSALASRDLKRIRANWNAWVPIGGAEGDLLLETAAILLELDPIALADDVLSPGYTDSNEVLHKCLGPCKTLEVLDGKVGQQKVMQAVKTILTTYPFEANPRHATIVGQIGFYMIRKNALTGENCELFVKVLADGKITLAALYRLGEAKCPVPAQLLTREMLKDWPPARIASAWVAGELKVQEVKPLLQRLATSDQFFDDYDKSYPVRDEANRALNKIDFGQGDAGK